MAAAGWPERIVVVGGGTAGWLAAMMLSDVAGKKSPGTSVTVIESSKIGVIGVGEGSTAVFRQMLRRFGLDEEEFLRETGATIKFGIRHRDWRRLGHHYDGPIDDPHLVAPGIPLDCYAVAAGKPVQEAHLFQHLIWKRRGPFAEVDGRRVPAGPFHHAFHFDQALVGQWLRKKARGIRHIDDQVTGVEKGGEGIVALHLEGGLRIEGDLFIDASGFRRRLVSEMPFDWISFSDMLPNNRALPFWLDLKDGEEIDPVTGAWAQGHGWMWQIPTQGRFGCGYVYCDAYITPEEAQAEIERTLGHPIEPRGDIRINPGRQRDVWVGNVVAVGLASSFLEPLEATSIHGTIGQLICLTEWLGQPGGKARYNATAARQVDDFRDFVRLHYVSERRDTAYWRDVTASHPPVVTERLEKWSRKFPSREDFEPFPLGLAHVQEQLYVPVLNGLGLLNQDLARAEMARDPKLRQKARETHASLVAEYFRAAERCLPHRAWLESLHKELAA
ncbi:tryptophan halogenase family protein [Rubellimicrobium roseum]|nr:tryptophan halogenase family protein [Rubellimicrobium roseum]